MTPAEAARLADLALEAAGAAAEVALERRRSGLLVGTKSTPTDLVTDADRAAEATLVERLLTARPDDGVLGEEGAAREGTSGIVWVIDPIDGTTNFVYDHPGWSVSVAACAEGRPLAAAVVVPSLRRSYRAARGGGAYEDGRRLRLAEPPQLAAALVATGFGYDPARRAAQADVLRGLLPRVRDVRRMGAASVDLCSVAAGRIDAYYEWGLAPWDMAAGWLVATEAGALVTDLDGGDPSSDMVIAAAPGLHRDLRGLLEALLAERS